VITARRFIPRALVSAVLAGCALLAACKETSRQSEPGTPALWEVSGPKGQHGFLFGTIHSLPDGYQWRTGVLDDAFAASDRLVVEVDLARSGASISGIFARLAHTPGLPPLSRRLPKESAALLKQAMDKKGLDDADFRDVESWAAALTLAQAYDEGSSANGADLALLKQAKGKRIVELEGVERQLRLFDALPEAEQRDLLAAVAVEALAARDRDDKAAIDHWLAGDAEALAQEASTGLLADPELREALLLARNRDWADRLEAELAKGGTVFVAVGAAHVVGPDGLAALLAARGYTVKRAQ